MLWRVALARRAAKKAARQNSALSRIRVVAHWDHMRQVTGKIGHSTGGGGIEREGVGCGADLLLGSTQSVG